MSLLPCGGGAAPQAAAPARHSRRVGTTLTGDLSHSANGLYVARRGGLVWKLRGDSKTLGTSRLAVA